MKYLSLMYYIPVVRNKAIIIINIKIYILSQKISDS